MLIAHHVLTRVCMPYQYVTPIKRVCVLIAYMTIKLIVLLPTQSDEEAADARST